MSNPVKPIPDSMGNPVKPIPDSMSSPVKPVQGNTNNDINHFLSERKRPSAFLPEGLLFMHSV